MPVRYGSPSQQQHACLLPCLRICCRSSRPLHQGCRVIAAEVSTRVLCFAVGAGPQAACGEG
jgi:hypothetical protein